MSSSIITNQKEQIKDFLDSAESVGIIAGENQNIDIMAGALGLYLTLSSGGRNVQIVSVKEPTVELSSLVGIDRVSKTFSGKTSALTISVPYREGEIEKVSYNIEDDRLNVNLFAEGAGITFSEDQIQYIRKGSTPSLVILIGVSNQAELRGLVDLKSVKTIVIDKNPMNALDGDVLVLDPSFSSFSEIITGLIMELTLPYDLDAFQNLMSGITHATRNFTSQNTSPLAFEGAGFLLQNGARRETRSRDIRHDDRFPKTEHLLNKKADQPFYSAQDRRDRKGQDQDSPGRNFNVGGNLSQVTQNQPASDSLPDLGNQEESGKIAESVPDDWFLPKVFKGSRKGN